MVWYGMVWYGMVWYGMVWYVSHDGQRGETQKRVEANVGRGGLGTSLLGHISSHGVHGWLCLYPCLLIPLLAVAPD